MTKKYEFGEKIRAAKKAIPVDGTPLFCSACGIAGLPLDLDHIVPRELLDLGNTVHGEISRLTGLPVTDADSARAAIVHIDNAGWLCKGCHALKSYAEKSVIARLKIAIEAGTALDGIMGKRMAGTYKGTKPTHIVPQEPTRQQSIFAASLRS